MKIALLCMTSLLLAAPAHADAVADSLAQWQPQATRAFSATRGQQLWLQDHQERSCSTCHGTDARQQGRHQNTGKTIAAMAPSVNPKRLTATSQIEKWLGRNCRWTLGRECSAQEKGDLILWLGQQ